MEQDLEHLLGRTLAGFYLTHLLGSGGMAVVFRGENAINRKLVRSIKIVRPEFADDPEFRARFASEAMILERLHHPNVVGFFGLREDSFDDEPFLVMELEYLEGHTLSTVLLRSTVTPPITEIARWMLDASEGVAAAHALGVVHRDLKPDNIFLTKLGVVKVLDFGVARALDDSGRSVRMTRPGTVPGSPAYLAPEICDGGTPSAATDVYSLGVSFAELLLGYHPYEVPGEKPRTTPQMLFAHIHEPLPRLRDALPDAPPSLEAFLNKATAKKPKDRFASAAEFAHALRALMPELSAPTAGPAIIRTEFAVPKMESLRRTNPPDAGASDGPSTRMKIWLALAVAGGLGVGAAGAYFGGVRQAPPTVATPVADAGMRDAGDIRTPTNPFVRIAAAPFGLVLGVPEDTRSGTTGFRPTREITAPTYAYAIQAHEVTWAELDPHLASDPSFVRPSWVPAEPSVRASLPATGVPWNVARAFCRSLGADLPSEEEWELAARGPSLAPYPWGDAPLTPVGTHAYAGEDARVRPVMTSPSDKRTIGADVVYDLAGNAREWTRDLYRADEPGQDESFVHRGSQTIRAVRGLPMRARLSSGTAVATVAHRTPLCAEGECPRAAESERENVGFRCVRP